MALISQVAYLRPSPPGVAVNGAGGVGERGGHRLRDLGDVGLGESGARIGLREPGRY
jgi:hypothetical protein